MLVLGAFPILDGSCADCAGCAETCSKPCVFDFTVSEHSSQAAEITIAVEGIRITGDQAWVGLDGKVVRRVFAN